MATESYLWKKIKPLYSYGHFTRHEDKVRRGISDVSYGLGGVNGFIELKGYASWPKNPEAVVPFANVKKGQVRFLKNRGKAGGHCFLMAIFGTDEIAMIHWKKLTCVGTTTKKDFILNCCFYHHGRLADASAKLSDVLTHPRL